MRNPFEHIDKAFEPMFDKTFSVKGIDGKNTSFKCSVFTDNTAEPLDDDMMETNCTVVNIVVSQKDWPFVRNLHRGDALFTDDFKMKKYVVYDVLEDSVFGIVVKARSV